MAVKMTKEQDRWRWWYIWSIN